MKIKKILFILILAGGFIFSDSVSETWCGNKVKGTHKSTLSVAEKGGVILVKFDLSALPKNTKILYCNFLYSILL